jgi:hypothetical protein
MKVFRTIMSVFSMLMIAFTMICGFWISNSGAVSDLASSAGFHMMLGIITAISVFITCILAIIKK